MSIRFEFERSISENSAFKYKKIAEEDVELLRHYIIKDWNNEDFDYESLLKQGYLIISNNRDMFLKPLGGGSFEIPEMYAFVCRDYKFIIESGGGGDRSRIFRENDDGSYDEEIIISRIRLPNNYHTVEDLFSYIAEGLAIDSFRSPKLNKLSINFILR